MVRLRSIPARGAVFLDARGESRALRLSWHEDQGVLVISLWRGDVCTGTFRLSRQDVPALVFALVRGLADRDPDRPGDEQPAG